MSSSSRSICNLRMLADTADVLDTNTVQALQKLQTHGVLAPGDAEPLIQAARLLNTVAHLLRICSEDGFVPEAAPDGLKSLLASACGEPELSHVELKLAESQATIRRLYDELIK